MAFTEGRRKVEKAEKAFALQYQVKPVVQGQYMISSALAMLTYPLK